MNKEQETEFNRILWNYYVEVKNQISKEKEQEEINNLKKFINNIIREESSWREDNNISLSCIKSDIRQETLKEVEKKIEEIPSRLPDPSSSDILMVYGLSEKDRILQTIKEMKK